VPDLSSGRVDLAVVGAGIVGLAHAVEAVERGLSVAVVEQDAQASGASIRNFGHVFVSAQAGEALDFALEARERWRRLAALAGFRVVEAGTVLVARWPEELEVIEEFVASIGTGAGARVLSPREALELAPVGVDGLLGALWTPLDLRVDPRRAVPALTAWLAEQPGVSFHKSTTVYGVEEGRLSTSRGDLDTARIVVAVGHDLDRLFPGLAADASIRRCTLQMLRVALPRPRRIDPALATGLSLLRYSGFLGYSSVDRLRARFEREQPELIEHEINLLLTQRPDGDLVLGDTHRYGPTPDPFRSERLDELLLEEASRLLGVDRLFVRERWLGVYAHSPNRDFLVSTPCSGVRAVTVTSGIGITTALGLAARVLDDLFDHAHAIV